MDTDFPTTRRRGRAPRNMTRSVVLRSDQLNIHACEWTGDANFVGSRSSIRCEIPSDTSSECVDEGLQYHSVSAAVAAIMLLAWFGAPSLAWAEGQSAPTTAPTSEAPRESPSAGSPMPPSAEILDASTVETVLGREVRSVADENMGRIVDVIVELSGQVRAAVIDFGGFLGVGSRKIAVDWNILRFGSGEKPARVVVELTQAQLKAAPEYKEGKPVVVLGTSAAMPRAEPDPAPSR
jgi:PRC-barrel domain